MECAFIFKHIIFIAPFLGFSLSDIKVPGERKNVIEALSNWPKYNQFGQISAIGIDSSGNLYVFHRGNRKWDSSTFSLNVFNDKDKGPISNETIVILEPNQGSLLKKTGANKFYLPHGLTVDSEDNVWVTDVALHQVFKFLPIDVNKTGDLGTANLTLGVPLEPGSDKIHFCKPTGVAIDTDTKEFYVSDGYCNYRIIKYDKFGKILLTLGRSSIGFPELDPYMLKIPHALALAQEQQTLYVADRENFRVLSYNFQSGKFRRSFAEELKSKVFSVAYSHLQGGLLFILTNDDAMTKMVAVYNTETGKQILNFSPKTNFTNPHDLAVSHDGTYCYIVELNPSKVWKFKLDMNEISQHAFSGSKNTNEKSTEVRQEPVPPESTVNKASNSEVSSSVLAAGLVLSIIIITFLIFIFHFYKGKGGYKRYETRRLILDEDEGGINLT